VPGYANRTVLLQFPELTEDGDDTLHVVLKNPKMVPTAELLPPELPPLDGESEGARDIRAMNVVIARLVKAWRVYDATSEGDDQDLLGLPATPELVGKLPVEIHAKIGEVLKSVRSPGQ
jgi:hypothetical protein